MIPTSAQQWTWESDAFRPASFTKDHKLLEMVDHRMDDSTADLTVDDSTAYSNTAVLDLVENYERNSEVVKSRKTYTLSDLLDSLLLCAFFSDTTTATTNLEEDDSNDGKPSREKTLVKVTATAFPRKRSRDRDEYREYLNMDLLRRKSCAFVGEVNESHQFKQGTMVTALKMYPMDTRFISIRSESLITLPSKLDPGEASAVLSTYLPAFVMLHHGSRDRQNRHSFSSLEGQNILLIGGDVIEQEALIKLAFMGGANKVSVLPVSQEGDPTLERRRFGRVNLDVLPLANPEAILSQLEGSMDLVIDLSFPLHFSSIQSTVRPTTGRLVARKNEPNRNILARTVSNMVHHVALFLVTNAYLFDFDCLSMNHNGDVKRDIQYLFQLLSNRRIRPNIDRFITRDDVTKVTEELANTPAAGDVICELRCTDY
ncbi:unnamed protein product [Cylindrotheca closterium]|uniref:Uncharacterized protein n=1 Tax=Cylindrotheca closterium TaxID=2856 RepID=A0AAD2FH14_9STRA|nr:unnamed protein product [Cylindrotheca closterium]